MPMSIDRLGGVDTLGYPASYRFELDGFTYQVTQRALLQWRSNIGVAYLGNIFEMLEHAGLDQWLLESKGIPLPIKDDGSNGDWNKARETRLSWLTNEQIKAKFLANPNPDAISDWNVDSAINLYGLPMSMPEKHGPFISQRFQRVAFQLWVDEVAGSPAPGTVIGVLAGDLLKEAGLVPPEGLNVAERPVVVVAPAPAPAPAPSTSQPRATAKPRATATAKPEGTAVPTVVATPPAANLTLSSLSLGDVGLSPAFDADTTTYTANAANEVESVTVTAMAADSAATVVIKLNGTVDDDGTVDLAEGDGNVITIEVTVNSDTATYTVTVTRAAAEVGAEGAVLVTLSLSDVTLSPAFSSETLNYTASVVNGIGMTTVKATVPAEAQIGPAAAATDDGHPVTLDVGANTINLAVTAGGVTTFYEIVITRGEAAADATLGNLELVDITLEPEFSRHTYRYTATVPNSDVATDITATGNGEAEIVYKVGGRTLASADAVPLTENARTTITIEVTSNDEKNTETYTVVVRRLGSVGVTDTSLASLSLGDITLDSDFSSGTRSYTATVKYGDADDLPITVTWAVNAAGADAQVIINGEAGTTAASGSESGTLGVGENFIIVRVTSPDDSAVQDYRITVNRQERVLSSDVTLETLATLLSLDPEFKAGSDVTEYTATVANSVRTVAVSATATNSAATVEVSKGDEIDATAYTLTVGDNVIVIKVTAEDKSIELYNITITKLGTIGAADASLVRLTINDTTPDTTAEPITLTPPFSGQRVDYTAEVSFATTQVGTGAGQFTPNQSGTTIEMLIDRDNDGQIDDTTTNVVLEVGPNKFIVRATTGTSPTASMDYNFTVTRLARVDSMDVTLSGLTLSDVTLVPAFNTLVRDYRATVGKTVESTTVEATATDTNAMVVIKPDDAVEGGDHQVELVAGPNEITIEVTAEDGTTKTTTVTVTRTPLSTDSSLSALSLKDGEDDVALRPPFVSGTKSYDANVDADVASVTLTATASDATAKSKVVTVNGGTLPADQGDEYTVLTPSSTIYTIKVTVTAEDDSTTTYTIELVRA